MDNAKATRDDSYTGYAVGELNFHDIGDNEFDYEVMSVFTQDHHSMKPRSDYTAEVMLSSKYKRCYESQGEYLYCIMPTFIDKE